MLWHVKHFDNGSLARDEVKAATCYGWMQCKRPCYGVNSAGPPSVATTLSSLSYNFFPVCVDAAGYRSIQLRRGRCYPRPTAACNNHRDTMGLHSCSSTIISEGVCGHTSVWLYNGSHTGLHSCSITTISKGCVWGHTSIWLYDETHPVGRCLRRRRENGRLPTMTSGAAPTSLPKGVFRLILRKKYRRAVGTHYGLTRMHQAGFSPRYQRDGRAGTTILQLASACYRH
jgi:hypothetical protein